MLAWIWSSDKWFRHGQNIVPKTPGGITRFTHELGRLARMFDSMVTGVKAREERLKTELRLARSIAHQNVVRSYDFGEW